MIDAATAVLMVLDADYRWWQRRAFPKNRRVAPAGYLEATERDGTRYVLVPVTLTKYARLMASEGFTGDCKPGRYRLLITPGIAPRLEPTTE
jgi:hypothetical protein